MFETLFAAEKRQLDDALVANTLEQNHLRRCMELISSIEWRSSNRTNELGRLLGVEGVLLFDRVVERIAASARLSPNPQLQDPAQFLNNAMYVHDLGKFDAGLGRFNGTGHEERSAQIVLRQRERLCKALGWWEESADLLVALTRFHSMLGIVHLGGASIVYLVPVLDWLLPFAPTQQRLFLDLLIVLTCCDAGASGNFETQTFYLNHARLETYTNAATELIQASRDVRLDTLQEGVDPQSALVNKATQLPSMVERIQRIVASNNRLSVSVAVAERVLSNAIKARHFDPVGFALTRFDHGTYVFEPLLHKMCPNTTSVPQEALAKLILLIGLMSQHIHTPTVLHLRDRFSMKPDLQPQNQQRFEMLFDAVSTGNVENIHQAFSD